MMFAGFLFLLLLTGGSSSNHTEPLDDQSSEESGSADSDTELLDWLYREGGSVDSELRDWLDGEDGREFIKILRCWYTGKCDMPARCSYDYMINYLNITDKVKFYLARPTKNHLRPTNIQLDVYLYSILDVKEKDQELVAYFRILMGWENKLIKWNPVEFCWMHFLTLPAELLWKPDITIEEVTVKDKLFQTPYLTVMYGGQIIQRTSIGLVSTCKMDFYRFPFDTQTCSLTFKSIQHTMIEINFTTEFTNEDVLNHTRHFMKTESEWLLMNVTVETKQVENLRFPLSVLVYTMTIKRRSVLYVANFIVPILFFLCLDLASFLISEVGGEKLSFKVTVLLAVTVMQLILNDILPSSSDRIPLIAVYCIGVFTLMMLSLLETILMMYLMEKDDVSQDQEADKDQGLGDDCRDQRGKVQSCFRDMKKSIPCVRVFDESPGETPPELLPEGKEGSSSQLTEVIHGFENLTDELREVSEKMSLLLSSRKEEKEPGYWTRMTKKLNRIYFVFYIITVSVFLGCVFSLWLDEDTKE